MNKHLQLYLLTVLVIVVTILLSLAQFRLPAPLPADAPPAEFSAMRAMERLARFATSPHPVGSAQWAATRDVLLSELTALGLEPQLQRTTGALPEYGVAGHVENIVARLPGENSSGAILLTAHYDSVPPSPGAGDNGAGVVVILETLRAILAKGTGLQNDLIVVLTDAEEVGTLGARAFAAGHPWMRDVQVVLNIEGTLEGVTLLVQTGPENGWFVREFVRAAPQPFAFAWVRDIYDALPLMTDFTPAQEAGLAGGDLYALAGGDRYHTPLDDIAHTDPRSVQHHGTQTLALVRHLGNRDLSHPHAPDAVYWSVWGPWVVRYPQSLAAPFAAGATGLFIAVLVLGLRRKRLTWKGMGLGVLAFLGTLLGVTLLVTLLWQGIAWLRPAYAVRYSTGYAFHANDGIYLAGFLMLTVALFAALYRWARTRLSWADLACGALWIWVLLMALSSLFLPGFSYLFTWPLLFSLGYLAWEFYSPQRRRDFKPLHLLLPLTLVPALLLWTPVIPILYAAVALNFLPAMGLLLVLLLGGLLAQLEGLLALRRLPAGALAVAAVLLLAGFFTAPFDVAHPRPTRATYFVDAGAGQAYWLTPATGNLDPWEQQFAGDDTQVLSWSDFFPPYGGQTRRSVAPVASLPAPEVKVLADTNETGIRTLRLRIVPAREGQHVMLSAAPGTIVHTATVENVPLFAPEVLKARGDDDWLTSTYAAPPASGIEVVLALEPGSRADFIVAERTPDLPPDVPGFTPQPRPATVMDAGDQTIVSRQVTFEKQP